MFLYSPVTHTSFCSLTRLSVSEEGLLSPLPPCLDSWRHQSFSLFLSRTYSSTSPSPYFLDMFRYSSPCSLDKNIWVFCYWVLHLCLNHLNPILSSFLKKQYRLPSLVPLNVPPFPSSRSLFSGPLPLTSPPPFFFLFDASSIMFHFCSFACLFLILSSCCSTQALNITYFSHCSYFEQIFLRYFSKTFSKVPHCWNVF